MLASHRSSRERGRPRHPPRPAWRRLAIRRHRPPPPPRPLSPRHFTALSTPSNNSNSSPNSCLPMTSAPLQLHQIIQIIPLLPTKTRHRPLHFLLFNKMPSKLTTGRATRHPTHTTFPATQNAAFLFVDISPPTGSKRPFKLIRPIRRYPRPSTMWNTLWNISKPEAELPLHNSINGAERHRSPQASQLHQIIQTIRQPPPATSARTLFPRPFHRPLNSIK